jgi:hypothetical protein
MFREVMTSRSRAVGMCRSPAWARGGKEPTRTMDFQSVVNVIRLPMGWKSIVRCLGKLAPAARFMTVAPIPPLRGVGESAQGCRNSTLCCPARVDLSPLWLRVAYPIGCRSWPLAASANLLPDWHNFARLEVALRVGSVSRRTPLATANLPLVGAFSNPPG